MDEDDVTTERKSSNKADLTHITAKLRPFAVPVDTVTGDPANVRTHPEKNLAAIKGSLTRFGQQKPVVVDAKGVTIAGAGVLLAARELGWTHVAAVRSDLSGADRAAFAIADNRASDLSMFDEKPLAEIIGELKGDNLPPGFTADEIEALNGRVRDRGFEDGLEQRYI